MDRLRQWLRNPWIATVAIGTFLVGLMALLSSMSSRRIAVEHPPGTLEPTSLGYQGLIGAAVVPTNAQFVATNTVALKAGDRIESEMVERRSATQVVNQYPTMRTERARKDPQAPPLDGYYEKVEDAVGKFALVDLPVGMPLGPLTVAEESPLADPLDRQRPDRFTVAMPPEPTLYQLLRPGDRVDVFLVVPGQLSRRTLHNVRVVAVNNYLAAGSGLLDAGAERERFGTRQEAAMRKRQRILAEQSRMQAEAAKSGKAPAPDGKAPPPAPPASSASRPPSAPPSSSAAAVTTTAAGAPAPPAAATTPGQAGGKTTQPGALQNFDEKGGDVAKAGKTFDGRAVTLQVSPAEALLLATAMCSPKVQIEFALRDRPR